MNKSTLEKPEVIYISKDNITHLLILYKTFTLYSNKPEDKNKIIECVLKRYQYFRNSAIAYIVLLVGFAVVTYVCENLLSDRLLPVFYVLNLVLTIWLSYKSFKNYRGLKMWLNAKRFLEVHIGSVARVLN